MKVFTVAGKMNYPGAEVVKLPNYNSEEEAIVVGSNENGCRMGVLRFTEPCNSKMIYHAEVFGKSIYGNSKGPKYLLKATKASKEDKQALVVLRTPVQKGGRNFHTGDRKTCVCYTCETEFDVFKDICSMCGRKLKVYYQDFKPSMLTSGTIRDSKKPIFGNQFVVIVKKNEVFRTAYNGFIYGTAGSHYHWFNGEKIISVTWEERKKMHLI